MENILWYNSEATIFEEALPIGNGSIGAMVYGGCNKEKISLNHDKLWSGIPTQYKRKEAYTAYKSAQEAILASDPKKATEFIEKGFVTDYSEFFLPLGNMYIDGLKDKSDNYRRELDIRTGIMTVENGDTKRTYFCSDDENALVIRLENEPDFCISLDSQLKYKVYSESDVYIMIGECPSNFMSAEQNSMGVNICEYTGEGIKFITAVKVITDGEISYGDKIAVSGATNSVVVLSAETSFIDFKSYPTGEYIEPCLSALNSTSKKEYSLILKNHINYFSEKFNRVKINLNQDQVKSDTLTRLKNYDKGLVELLYNFGRYLIISSSTPGTSPTNLQGIWNDRLYAPWNSGFTTNINLEMNYWPVLMNNLTEYYEPLLSFIKNLSVSGKDVAKYYYHADGFALHHNTDIWAMASADGQGIPGCTQWAFWNASGGWLCQHIFEYYEYTNDIEYLREIGFPIMKEAAKFYLDILVDYDGKLIVTPTTSPENTYELNGEAYGVAKWATMTQTIVSELFGNIIKCCDILNCDAPLKKELEEKLPKLSPFHIADDGRLMEWDDSYKETDPNHRHVSHMYGLYPGGAISIDSTPDLAEACKKTLNVRGDAGTGWSIGWKANLWARLKDGNRTLKIIEKQLELVDRTDTVYNGKGGTYPNLFDAHPPFQIDGNFAVAAAVAQMLVQSVDGKIKILPALPDSFKDGSVSGLLAKGNVEVDIVWENMKAISVTLKAKNKAVNTIVVINEKEYEVALKQGEIVKVL